MVLPMQKSSHNILLILFVYFLILTPYPTSVHAKRVAVGIVTIKFDLSQHGEREEARIWVPYPVSDPYQTISKIVITGTHKEGAVYTDNQYGNPILYAYWPTGVRERRLTLSFEVKREERIDCPPEMPSNSGMDRGLLARYLQTGGDERVLAISKEITKGKRTPIEKARAVYEWVTKNLRRNPATRGCGKGDVCYTLFGARSGKCADISSVYVALLRAAGIPSRERFGLRLGRPEKGVADITTWQHCWAEFYIPGHGWVASDPADYLKAILTKRLCHKDPEAKRLYSYYFCSIDPFRVGLSRGREIMLNPPQAGPRLNYFMYPYGEVGERPLDPLSPKEFSYQIRYKPLP